eukprot:3514419-Pyramimonas_sp.AAC.1
MPKSGSQMGFCLAPRDFNDCYNPLIDKWNGHLNEQDITYGLLRTRSPAMKAGEEVDIGLATFMDDVTRTHVWLGTPSVNEAVTTTTYATERLEQYIAE